MIFIKQLFNYVTRPTFIRNNENAFKYYTHGITVLIVCMIQLVMSNDYNSPATANEQNNLLGQENEISVKDYPSVIELATILKGLDYPAAKNTIVNSVISDNTDKNIAELLGQIEDKVYNNASEVVSATGLVKRE